MEKHAKKLAKAGRNGDTCLAHLTPGEVVIPKSVAPLAKGLLGQVGIDPQRYTVGGNASKNPRTGLLEFYEDAGDNESGRGGERSYGGGRTSDGGLAGRSGGGGSDADQREASRRERAGIGEGGWDAGGYRDDGRYGRADGSFGSRDRAASFGASGVDLGSGILRARTPQELARYGISMGDLVGLGARGMSVVAPGATMPSMSRALSLAGAVSPLPGGSVLGSMAGNIIDRNALAQGVSGLGYDGRYSNALATGATTPNGLRAVIGPVADAALGPFAGLAHKVFGNPLEKKAADLAFRQTMAGQQPDRVAGADVGKTARSTGLAALTQREGPAQQGYSPAAYAPGPVMAMDWSPLQWGAQYDPLKG